LKKQYESIKTEIDAVISEVLSKTAFIGGPYVKDFEEAFARFCGVRHCIGVGNGTDALFIALRALGIGPGDEVITVANSFIATSEAITMAGAKVVFADIDPVSYNIDPKRIEEKVTPRTKAIVPVHLYGHPADMGAITAIARKHGLRIVEDAAQAHGAEYEGRRVGSLGDMACFSFYPGKNLGAYGDAGAIVTDDDGLALQARMFANHGRISKYDHEMEGINSRLDGLQAAILRIKLSHLPEWTERRRRNARLYHRHLSGLPLVTPAEGKNVRSVYHLYVVRVESAQREGLQAFLQDHGISTGIHYPIALPNLKAYEYMSAGSDVCREATKASGEILSLPMFPELEEEQIVYITGKIGEFFAGGRR
ncbi:DegT/DnrJ/EryC1/StrS family aminotransferase, partial [bacterium]|nr:DegT/DnrJ/EryC1/StrS family aminotransferase [bacterium]